MEPNSLFYLRQFFKETNIKKILIIHNKNISADLLGLFFISIALNADYFFINS